MMWSNMVAVVGAVVDYDAMVDDVKDVNVIDYDGWAWYFDRIQIEIRMPMSLVMDRWAVQDREMNLFDS